MMRLMLSRNNTKSIKVPIDRLGLCLLPSKGDSLRFLQLTPTSNLWLDMRAHTEAWNFRQQQGVYILPLNTCRATLLRWIECSDDMFWRYHFCWVLSCRFICNKLKTMCTISIGLFINICFSGGIVRSLIQGLCTCYSWPVILYAMACIYCMLILLVFLHTDILIEAYWINKW